MSNVVTTESGKGTRIIRFNANNNEGDYGNPMTKHAVGYDIHPYLIKVLYLISY